MAESMLGGVVEFLRRVGFYDVILPFLLVFTLVYAVLEKTQVLGQDKSSLNSMIAFTIGIIVIGATRVVSVINEALANVTLVLVIATFFLVTISVFLSGEGQYNLKTEHPKAFAALVVLIGITILAIFFQALGWNEAIWDFLKRYGTSSGVMAILFIIGIAIFMGILVRDPKEKKDSDDDNE